MEHKPKIESRGLGKKAATSAAWLSFARMITKSIGSLRLLILAAILPLDQLGLFGIAALAMQFASKLSETGMSQALIQKEGKVSSYLGTAWLSQITRGCLLCAVLFFSAPHIESFFGKPGVARLLTVMALLPLIQGLQNVGLVFLHRELKFNKLVIIEMVTTPVELIASISIVWFWRDAMGLVIAKIIGAVTGMVLGFLVEKRRGDLSFSVPKFRELYSFGFWIFLGAILSFTLVRGGDLIIGKYLSEETLAMYQIAYSLACLPLMEVMAVVGKPTFSVYSRLQDEPARLSNAFLRVFALACYVAAFSIAGFYCLSFDFVNICMKEELLPIAAMLPWLAVWAACRALGASNSVVLKAIGKPAYATIFQVFMLILFITILMPMAISYGTYGVIYSLVGIGLSAQLLRYSVLKYILQIPFLEILYRCLIPATIAFISALVSSSIIRLIDGDMHLVRLLVGLLTLVVVYASLGLYTDRHFSFGLSNFAVKQFPSLRKLVRPILKS